MKSVVKKWGNSAAIRIPAAVMEAIPLELGELVDVRVEAGRIVIEPDRQKQPAKCLSRGQRHPSAMRRTRCAF